MSESVKMREAQASLAYPTTFKQRVRWVGPSFMVAAAAVGSGEIINGTRLGAMGGLTVLWVIVIGVVLKGFIQQEIGRYTVVSGRSVVSGFAEVPGPSVAQRSWFFWLILVLLAVPLILVVGGIGGAIGGAMELLLPGPGAKAWGAIALLSIIPLLLLGTLQRRNGKRTVYQYVEMIMLAKVVLLTVVIVYLAAYGVPTGDERFSYGVGDLLSGLTFQLPGDSQFQALAVLAGIGAGVELIFYSPWLVSKGYARHAHAGDAADSSLRIASWLSVMKLDTWLGVAATLVVSVAYFILGATVLNELGIVPEGLGVVSQLGEIMTATLGEGYNYAFMVVAIVALYGTAVAVADGSARFMQHAVHEVGTTASLDDASLKSQRTRTYRATVLTLVAAWVLFSAVVAAPTFLITLGSALLALVFPCYAVVMLFLDRTLPREFQMTTLVRVVLLGCFLLFGTLAIYTLVA